MPCPVREKLSGDAAESHRQPRRAQAQGLAVALSQARKRRRSDCPRRGSVHDALRLRHTGFRAALEGAYVLEDRAGTRSFSSPGLGGGPRMLPGSDAIRDWRGEQRGRGAVHDSAHSSGTGHPRALGRQPPRGVGRSGCSAEVMASDGATGHRFRNLWPDRQESPGHPGGSGHRSRSRDHEKSLLRRGYTRLVPCPW